jgi:hypothetical protein
VSTFDIRPQTSTLFYAFFDKNEISNKMKLEM